MNSVFLTPYGYTMATVPTICFLIIVMVLILILSTLTSVQSFETSGNAAVMQEASAYAAQYAPVEHYGDEELDVPEKIPEEGEVDAESGELVEEGGQFEAFEGGELHAYDNAEKRPISVTM